jgi:hypothetical protein
MVKKRWEILKGYSEAVNPMTDNTMTKRKQTERPTMVYKTLHRKLKIEWYEAR